MVHARIPALVVVAALTAASCVSGGGGAVQADGTGSPTASDAAPAAPFASAVDTVPLSSPAPTVPATGGAPRANPVGRVEGDLQLDGHLVMLGADNQQSAGRIINLETDEVVAFSIDSVPDRFSAPVIVNGLMLFAANGLIVALDPFTLATTEVAQGDWVSPSSDPNRFWVTSLPPDMDLRGQVDWVEMDLAGAELRTHSTTGSIDPEISTDADGTTIFVGPDLEPLTMSGTWPVGRLGSAVLLASCQTIPEVEPSCAISGIDQATGDEVDAPIAAEFVSTALNMDDFLVDPTGRYLLSARYRNDVFAAAVLDLTTGEPVAGSGVASQWCGSRGAAWNNAEPAVVACGGIVIDVESGAYARYGVGQRFAARLIAFTD